RARQSSGRGSERGAQPRPAARGWVLRSPVDAASAEDESATPPLDEEPAVQPYPSADARERVREEQLSTALRVAKATDADPEAGASPGACRRPDRAAPRPPACPARIAARRAPESWSA